MLQGVHCVTATPCNNQDLESTSSLAPSTTIQLLIYRALYPKEPKHLTPSFSFTFFSTMGKSKKNNTDDTALQMARWSGSAYSTAQFSLASPPPELPNKKILGFGSSGQAKPIMVDDPLPIIEHDDLKQGSLYIIKIRNVCVALFEGKLVSSPKL